MERTSLFNWGSAIAKFNAMYKLPKPEAPALTAIGDTRLTSDRLKAFKKILLEEIEEIDEIISKVEVAEGGTDKDEATILTDLADWLGDVQVYCASEMLKYGLHPNVILSTIMESNASKLGADGKPIYDGRGKVLKGPNYWKPEPKIREWIQRQWLYQEDIGNLKKR